MVIKRATNLPLIIDYIQSALKVTYVFSLLATLQSAKQPSWHETEHFSVVVRGFSSNCTKYLLITLSNTFAFKDPEPQ